MAAAGVLIVTAGALFGATGWAAAGAISLLWIAWRYDNEVGLCLPLAILFLIVIAADLPDAAYTSALKKM